LRGMAAMLQGARAGLAFGARVGDNCAPYEGFHPECSASPD